MAKLPAMTAEKHLAHQLRILAETMARREIAPEVIQDEIRTLENAIRAELWCVLMSSGDAA